MIKLTDGLSHGVADSVLDVRYYTEGERSVNQ